MSTPHTSANGSSSRAQHQQLGSPPRPTTTLAASLAPPAPRPASPVQQLVQAARPPVGLRTRSYDSAGRPKLDRLPSGVPGGPPAEKTEKGAKALAHSSSASSRLTSFLRNPPPSHTHIPPSLAGSLLLESQHSPFHRRTLSRKDPSGGPRRPSFSSTFSDGRVTLAGGNASSGHCPTLQSPTEEASPNDACSRSTSRTSSSSGSGSGSSDDSGSGGRHDSGSSSGEMTSSGSPSEDDGSQSSPSGQHAVGQQGRREYFPEDYLLSPWLTPQEFDKSTPSITRREMEARLGSMASYFDHD